ncbi:phage tail assembly protein [Glutamicibacter creatinolyticus]|uniref:phage tail assembly protein n=1 Tax=Glutamicibacter creatinolyticus TaxID=162496 RepID=UPI0032175CCC
MAKLTLDQIAESASKKFEHVEVDVPTADGVETVVLQNVVVLPREKRKSFGKALELQKRFDQIMELPEEERPDTDLVGLLNESIKEALESVTRGGAERFKILNDAFTQFDEENPEAVGLWRDLFDTYQGQVDLEKA